MQNSNIMRNYFHRNRYYIKYLLSILLIGYRKSRATSAAECTNELSTGPISGPNSDPKKLLCRLMTCGLLGFTGDTDLLIFSSENEQTSPISSSSTGRRGDLRILLRAGEEDLGMHIVEVI